MSRKTKLRGWPIRRLGQEAAPIRLLAFVGLLAVLWLPIYGLCTVLVDDPNSRSIVVMAMLFLDFLLLLQIWQRRIYGRDRPLHHYGLGWDWRNGRSLVWGYGIGLLCLGLLFVLQQGLGWIQWTSLQDVERLTLLNVGISGLLVGLGVGLGEELVFRGWLLDELEQDYAAVVALWGSSLLFAVLHFIRPPSEIIRTFPQFPGLMMLGLVLVWAKRSRQGQLGISIGLHAGLVSGYYWVNVGQLVQYQPGVPEWWSGVDRNPLAGLLSLGFLTILAIWFRSRAIVAIRD